MLEKILKIVNPALVAAVIFFAVAIFYQGVEYRLNTAAMEGFRAESSRPEPAGKKGASESRDTAGFSDYEMIVDSNFFDVQKKRQAEEEEISGQEIKDMEKTKLNLRLWGTITGSSGSSYAVIENESDREQQLYQVDDAIEEARIKKILRKRVVLDVNGKDEVLEIEDLVDRDITNTRKSRGSEGEGRDIKIKRERISEALQDINNLMQQVRVRPYFEQGEPAGIMLSGIRRDSIFEEMGVKSGDIIKSANGRTIRSMDDAMAFYEDLSSAGEVELEIQRDGSRQTINYSIE
ncbi:MAG: type II secretion system protein N [Desulfobacterales bacterium]